MIYFTLFAVPSGSPTEVSVLILSETAILTRWAMPNLFEQHGPIVGYKVILTYSNGSNSEYNISHGDVFSLQIKGKGYKVYRKYSS